MTHPARSIRGLLERVRARQRRNRIVLEMSDLSFGSLVALVVWAAWNALMPASWMIGSWLPATAVAVLVARAVVRIGRAEPLWRAAAAADQAADLHDEMISAWWFARQESPSPWAELHVDRADERAQGLDARALVPALSPRRPGAVAALAMALAAITLLPVPRLFEPMIERLAEVLPGAGDDVGPVAELSEAVAEEPPPPAPPQQEMLLPADSEGGEEMLGEEGAPQEGEESAEQEPGEQQGEPGEEGEPAEGQEGEPQDQEAPSDAEGEPSADASEEPGEGEAAEDSGAMLPGGDEVFLQESGEDMQQAEQTDEEMGHATREGGTEQELDPGELTALEVQLQREMLVMPEEPPRADPDAEEEEKEEEVTKAERSFLEFADRPATQESAVQEMLESEAIPWRYRQLVLDYFKALRARDNLNREKQQ